MFDNQDYFDNHGHYDYDYEHDHLVDDNSDVLIVQILPRLQYCNDQFHWSGPGLHVSEHKRYHPCFMIIITIDIWMMVLYFVIIILLVMSITDRWASMPVSVIPCPTTSSGLSS